VEIYRLDFINGRKVGSTGALLPGLKFLVESITIQDKLPMTYRKYSSSDEIQVNKFNGFGDAIVKIGFNGAYEYKIDPKTRFSIGGTLRYIGSLAHFSMTSDAPIGSLYFLKRDEVQASNLKLIYQYSHNLRGV
jgi:hypothetical protein